MFYQKLDLNLAEIDMPGLFSVFLSVFLTNKRLLTYQTPKLEIVNVSKLFGLFGLVSQSHCVEHNGIVQSRELGLGLVSIGVVQIERIEMNAIVDDENSMWIVTVFTESVDTTCSNIHNAYFNLFFLNRERNLHSFLEKKIYCK